MGKLLNSSLCAALLFSIVCFIAFFLFLRDSDSKGDSVKHAVLVLTLVENDTFEPITSATLSLVSLSCSFSVDIDTIDETTTIPDLPGGSFNLSISSPHHSPFSRQFYLEEGQIQQLVLFLEALNIIEGIVLSMLSKSPLYGARVVLQCDSLVPYQTWTNSLGFFRLTSSVETCLLTVSMNGWSSIKRSVLVQGHVALNYRETLYMLPLPTFFISHIVVRWSTTVTPLIQILTPSLDLFTVGDSPLQLSETIVSSKTPVEPLQEPVALTLQKISFNGYDFKAFALSITIPNGLIADHGFVVYIYAGNEVFTIDCLPSDIEEGVGWMPLIITPEETLFHRHETGTNLIWGKVTALFSDQFIEANEGNVMLYNLNVNPDQVFQKYVLSGSSYFYFFALNNHDVYEVFYTGANFLADRIYKLPAQTPTELRDGPLVLTTVGKFTVFISVHSILPFNEQEPFFFDFSSPSHRFVETRSVTRTIGHLIHPFIMMEHYFEEEWSIEVFHRELYMTKLHLLLERNLYNHIIVIMSPPLADGVIVISAVGCALFRCDFVFLIIIVTPQGDILNVFSDPIIEGSLYINGFINDALPETQSFALMNSHLVEGTFYVFIYPWNEERPFSATVAVFNEHGAQLQRQVDVPSPDAVLFGSVSNGKFELLYE
ncbi:hypothetical protein RCL1_005067 [Eukaryota sp. TZLM3-RCL]